MEHLASGSRLFQLWQPPTLTVITVFFLITVNYSSALYDNLSFSFPSFNSNSQGKGIVFQGDAFLQDRFLYLSATVNQENKNLTWSIGWATYGKPMHLWDKTTGNTADFSTNFSFIIDSQGASVFADSLTFFLVPNGTQFFHSNDGGFMGLCSYGDPSGPSLGPDVDISRCNTTFNFIAVEFDTFNNEWDPPPLYESIPHVGIDINTIQSAVTKPWQWNRISSGGQVEVQIEYNSSTGNLSVVLFDEATSDSSGNSSSLSYQVELSDFLPEWVTIGFSGTTSVAVQLNQILSWDFSSTLLVADPDKNNRTTSVEPRPAPSTLQPPTLPAKRKNKTWVIVVSCTGAFVLLLIMICAIAWIHRSKYVAQYPSTNEGDGTDKLMIDEEFEKLPGFMKFTFHELATSTNDYAEGQLLGEGGSGKVYEGYLSRVGHKVAIKKIIPDSDHGMKEYAAEVKAVSQLRHRSLVQLIGWCHQKKELLIVYEFMSNGSLDQHLFWGKSLLTWEVRFKIAQDLASAVLYLHEEWSQCVVHRDIKSSNVMLDSEFNAKLGDFGLARLFDHGKGPQTTMLAGTMGYMAPECIYTGKASKESDVYSFGVVILEIACGRRVVEPRADKDRVQLVNWVWELYATGNLSVAVDPKLEDCYDKIEFECMMIVGLWCANPAYIFRPPIREAFNVLTFSAPLPLLPLKMPVLLPQQYSSTSSTTDYSTYTASTKATTSYSSSL